jgi:hypothetical protein
MIGNKASRDEPAEINPVIGSEYVINPKLKAAIGFAA